jgi:hypothetical protein
MLSTEASQDHTDQGQANQTKDTDTIIWLALRSTPVDPQAQDYEKGEE